MIKLNEEVVRFIRSVIDTSTLVGIESAIIDETTVRGVNCNRSVVIYHTKNIPAITSGSIGLNNIKSLSSRMTLAASYDDFSVSAKAGDNHITQLKMSGGSIKIDYRCANPTAIGAPKSLKDDGAMTTIGYDEKITMLLTKGQVAMGAENIGISVKDGVLSYSAANPNGDEFTYTDADNVSVIGNDFSFQYSAKILLTLLKSCEHLSYTVSERGLLTIIVNGLSVVVIPQV